VVRRPGPAPRPPTRGRAARRGRPFDDLFGETEDGVGGEEADRDRNGEEPPSDNQETDGGDESGLTASAESDEIRDLALASEGTTTQNGHEITSAPSDADQDETARIVTEAVEEGESPERNEADEAGAEGNVPPAPTKRPFSTDDVEGRDSDMHQP